MVSRARYRGPASLTVVYADQIEVPLWSVILRVCVSCWSACLT